MPPSCCFSILAHLPKGPSKLDWLDNSNERSILVNQNGDGESPSIQDVATNMQSSQLQEEKDSLNPSCKKKHVILMEIVGAMCLETNQRRKVDPYCSVRIYDNQKQDFVMVHRTDTIRNDGNPIWTAKTKSLCLIEITETAPYEQREIQTIKSNKSASVLSDVESINSTVADDVDSVNCVIIDIMHGNSQFLGSITSTPMSHHLLGRVRLPFSKIIRVCSSFRTSAIAPDRLEYAIKSPTGGAATGLSESATLALRFRFATERDLVFLSKLSQSHSAVREATKASADHSKNTVSSLSTALWQPSCDDRRVAADINFRHVKSKALALSYKKVDSNGIEKFRVIPYPDPDRPDTTTWMSAPEMERTAYEPSNKWVTAGGGALGSVYLEILGCDNLPQRDTDFSQTDAVVAVVFEDNFVRSDVIWDQFCPRWMPWTTRAFQFNIRHPASLLCISVLDCDEALLEKHDPIGRIVIRPSSFKARTTYVLHYSLQDDPNEQPSHETAFIDDDEMNNSTDVRSREQLVKKISSVTTVIIRLRIEWKDECAAMKMFFTSPPHFIVNVDNEKSYEVLAYTTRGLGFMHDASIKSVKLLANEIMDYGRSFCFTIDVLMEIWLWRGRAHLARNVRIWFPIHSIALFAGAIALVERPDMIIPIVLFGVAWILLSLNYHANHHPNPWLRVPSYFDTIFMTLFGRHTLFPSSSVTFADIHYNQGRKGSIQQDKLDEMKAARMSALIQGTMAFLLKIYYMYSKTGNKAIIITTDRTNKWDILSSKLKYIHMFLKYVCQYSRLGRSFISWKSNYTAVVTSYCILLASAWCIFPFSTAAQWILRLLVFVFFGPLMKLVDIFYVHRWFATKDELLARIRNGEGVTKESDLPDFDSLLENKTFSSMIHMGRVKAEELYKLRDMRSLMFGPYSELIPFFDNSRRPSIPLPQSTAIQMTDLDASLPNTSRGYHVPGQLLSGNMIHARDEFGFLSEPK